jgi:hypothetical protein
MERNELKVMVIRAVNYDKCKQDKTRESIYLKREMCEQSSVRGCIALSRALTNRYSHGNDIAFIQSSLHTIANEIKTVMIRNVPSSASTKDPQL